MYLPLESLLKILIVMEGPLGSFGSGGQVDCAFALGAQQRPRPSETKNATQIFIGTTPSSQPDRFGAEDRLEYKHTFLI